MARGAWRARRAGFTLIEMLAALALIGVLAATAIPSYLEAMRRGVRAEARMQLMQAAGYLERFQVANDSYAQDRLGNSVANLMPAQLRRSPAQGEPMYVVELTDGQSRVGTTDFLLVMKPLASARMGGDACGAFTLDSLGRRGVQGGTRSWEECWK